MTYREVLGSVAGQKIRAPAPAGEVNWKSSMLFCQTLSEAIEKYGTSDLPANFAGTIEPFVNNMLECAISERTQLSVAACRAIGSLPKVLGKDFHPFIDRILPVLIKHTASTKTVNQKSAAAAITNMIIHVPYNPRLLWHICNAFEDKNVGPRLHAPEWLKLILQHYHKSLHPDREYPVICASITLGLLDADNNVRTKTRALYWEYYNIDQTSAYEDIKIKLNAHAITALDNDPNNPERKPEKPKAKKPAERPGSSLAQVRQQAKKKMQERSTEQNNVAPSQSITSANFVVGPIEIDDPVTSDTRVKKTSRDTAHRHTAVTTQPEAHHISKPASRSIAVHKKGLSHDGQVQQITKKPSTMDIGNDAAQKKPASSESLRSSQNKKSATAGVSEPQPARSLMSAPVRRPRIVATPMNAPQPSSRPSSRTGHAQLHTHSSDSNMRATTKEPASSLTQQSSGSATTTSSLTQHMNKLNIGSATTTSSLTQQMNKLTLASTPQAEIPRVQPIKISKKVVRSEITSPVMIPDGKENAVPYTNTKSSVRAERIPSPSRKPLETTQQRVEVTQHGFEHAANEPMSDIEFKSARRALTTALELLTSNHMDYMGFRKLKNLVCNVGPDLIVDKDQYNTLMEQLISRLGSIDELVFRGDTKDMSHPTYIRQAILHMMVPLLQNYHPAWSDRYMGAALGVMMLARCAYSPNYRNNDRDHPVPGQPYQNQSSTVELIGDSMDQIIHYCPNPLDVLDSILDALAAGEQFVLEHVDDLPQESSVNGSWRSAAASYDRYNKKERLWLDHYRHCQTRMNMNPEEEPKREPITNRDGFKESGSDGLPSKLPFLMETALKLITPLMEKARNMGLSLYPAQEDVLGDLAQHVLKSYNDALIRRQVMPFCEQLYLSSETEEKFWSNFQTESDRNLMHYYLADVQR